MFIICLQKMYLILKKNDSKEDSDLNKQKKRENKEISDPKIEENLKFKVEFENLEKN